MFQRSLKREREKLEYLEKNILHSLKNAPKGHVRALMNDGKYPQFYYYNDDDNNSIGVYLKKEKLDFAARLVKKEYDKKMLACVQDQLKKIRKMEKWTFEELINQRIQVFDKLAPAKKTILMPYELPENSFIENWYEEHPGNQNSFPIENGFITERGEYVRSKSEKMIADMLFYRGIPYQYEAILYLDDRNFVYPDFTILNINTRKTLYLEHFGMMDQPDYCKKALEKMEIYEKNAILQQVDIFYTMESSLKPINVTLVEQMMEHYFS